MNYGMIATSNHLDLLRCALPQPSRRYTLRFHIGAGEIRTTYCRECR